ncbi:anterior gradient protein 3-like [Cynoglossus semilaevis]|uniref:Anterior gradient 1 n=1 Tax=Cynoglossus semilaevis TaxID=244447 RepID=A0A3P8WWU7_CYNSE|nr:anterior gradient protein 3-like [Cynoglossus semilaevis]XP_008327313.1 anterior gradient protein 3-like [Cynoglossus semilaevis]XP_024919785.1 anterior gradient protein 3-like [Cynoglossus semilaevis]
MKFRWLLLTLIFGVCVTAAKEEKEEIYEEDPDHLSRGWGSEIRWSSGYEPALIEMAANKKPLMVIHHKDDCPYSQALKKAFVEEESIMKMAQKDFIMVNVVEETGDPNMAPDGYYVPRILFVDPSLTVRADIKGQYSNHHYTYEPKDMELLAQNMEKAKNLLHDEL